MVADKADVLSKRSAAPDTDGKIELAKAVTETGEALIHLRGRQEPVEVHAYDSHFYTSHGVIYTEGAHDGDEDLWLFEDDIIMVERH